MPMPQPYRGISDYCYANAASMLLASAGHDVSPSVFECLSAVGVGATYFEDTGELYFSNRPPDLGVSAAFEALGTEVACKVSHANAAELLGMPLAPGTPCAHTTH